MRKLMEEVRTPQWNFMGKWIRIRTGGKKKKRIRLSNYLDWDQIFSRKSKVFSQKTLLSPQDSFIESITHVYQLQFIFTGEF